MPMEILLKKQTVFEKHDGGQLGGQRVVFGDLGVVLHAHFDNVHGALQHLSHFRQLVLYNEAY